LQHGSQTIGNDEWSKASEKARIFTLKLTIEEKIAFTYGNATAGAGCIGVIPPIPRLNFTGVCMSDGPNAVNRAEFITVFPSGITAAATWDRNLIYQRAHALGEEARGKGTKVLLGYGHAMISRINIYGQLLIN
jgi:beta-glucosidase